MIATPGAIWNDSDESIRAGVRVAFLKRFPDFVDRVAQIGIKRWECGLPKLAPGRMTAMAELTASVGGIHFCGDYTEVANLEGSATSGMQVAGRYGHDRRGMMGTTDLMTLGAAIEREGSLSERLAARIEEAIGTGELLIGTPFPSERLVAEQFGVSRTVVREAVRTLVARGLLDVRLGPARLSPTRRYLMSRARSRC